MNDYSPTWNRPTELCQLFTGWNRRWLASDGVYVEEKIDGWRALAYGGQLWTRNGHEIHGTGHILHRLAMFEAVAGLPLMIDGEFQVGGTLEATKEHCERGHKHQEAGTLFAFDILPYADWVNGGSDRPLHERRKWLEDLALAVDQHPLAWEWRAGTHGKEPEGPAIVILPAQWADSVEVVQTEAKRVWSKGGEGLVIKDPDSPYQRKRVNHWQKVKR